MTEDTLDPNFDILSFPPSVKTDKIEKAFKDLRGTSGEQIEGETNFDFGGDDFGWM